MFRLIHCSDIHLNFCHEEGIKQFCRRLIEARPDVVVITGDIAEAQNVVPLLGLLQIHTAPETFPIFFVLGNHDYYNGSIRDVKKTMENLFTYQHKGIKVPQIGKGDPGKRLVWLGSSEVVPLTNDVCLVGADGLYDGQYANWFASRVDMNDYYVIKELSWPACVTRGDRFDAMNVIAKEDATLIKANIDLAFKEYKAKKVFVATHIPPFKENAVYNGKVSDEHWMPHFSSKATGDELLAAAIENPDKEIVALCGHSHGEAEVKPMPNLLCYTGPARYRHPAIARIWEF